MIYQNSPNLMLERMMRVALCITIPMLVLSMICLYLTIKIEVRYLSNGQVPCYVSEEPNSIGMEEYKKIIGRLEYIGRVFTYQGFISDPLKTIREINESGVFYITVVPRTLVIFIKRKKRIGIVERMVEDLRCCERGGGGYTQRNVKRSFNRWQRSIVQEILKGRYEIERRRRGIMENIFGVGVQKLLEAKRELNRQGQALRRVRSAVPIEQVSELKSEPKPAKNEPATKNESTIRAVCEIIRWD